MTSNQLKIVLNILTVLSLIIFLNLNTYAQGYVCAIGGGSEDYNDWSDAPYGWIVQKADSGRVIIISDAEATNWLPNYFMFLGADTAYNKSISSISTANLQSTYNELISAKAIFIRGGDQWDYIRLWKGTKLDSAINFVFKNGGVIAGTSAGAALLGSVDFSARYGSVYPDDALLNPFYNRMQFEYNFINLASDVLFDTHFTERGRFGRLIAMLYNQYINYGKNILGVGIDDRTAICISPNGIGEVMGSGAVSFFSKDNKTSYTNFSGRYNIENLKAEFLTKNWKFDFINRRISFIPPSAKNVDTNQTCQSPRTSIVLTGTDDEYGQLDTILHEFLTNGFNDSILVISNPDYDLTSISGQLIKNGFNFNILRVTDSNLNDVVEAEKITRASFIIIVGDSLKLLSTINRPGTEVSLAFEYYISSKKNILLLGNSGKTAGEYFVDNTDSDIYAAYRGKMTLNSGLNLFGELIIQPLIFKNEDYYENRTCSVLWGMMRSRKRIGIYLNGNGIIKINEAEKYINGEVQVPYIILDSRYTTKMDSSTYRANGSIGPRQAVAMNDVRISLTNNLNDRYLYESGKFYSLTDIKDTKTQASQSNFILNQNYPNPFNPSTTISWNLKTEGRVTIRLYDILGNEVETILNEFQKPGFHFAVYNAGSFLSSGVYFYKLSTPNFSETKSMVLIK